MGTVIIYHNNRCSKSRSALQLIETRTKEFQVIEYLKDPPSAKELKALVKKLGMTAEDLVRKKEPLFRKKFELKKLSESDWIKVLVKNPILIERPIIVNGNKAVIGRPPENVNQIL